MELQRDTGKPHNPRNKPFEISRIHQQYPGDKGHERGVSRDAGGALPVRKEEPARLPFYHVKEHIDNA
ncbi:hypothetical protein CF112_09315 [Aeromonas hydrophila]|nr:hypothetical protein CF112_09315 [Aeromonas hydrophila]